ncbi:MAG: anti-sigma factor [Phycisphaerae bacterium]|nr:anti-sigma factor [Gemmatimonadaceae bacterium]
MSDLSMTELRDMAPAYVLGALNTDDIAAFERVLAASDELQQEVNAYRSVVTQIGTARELSPPPAIRARFLQNIAAQRSASIASTEIDTTSAGTSSNAAPAEPEKRPFTVSTGGAPAPKPATDKAPRERSWLTAAIAVGLAASLIFAVQRNSQVTSLTTQLAQRDSILAARTVQLAKADSSLNTILEAGRNLLVVNLVTAPDNGPSLQFFWNVKTSKGMIHAVGLKPAEAGKIYQLWLIKDGKPVPSILFNTAADGSRLQWGIELPAATTGVSAVAITVEPAGGSPQPTTTPFLVGELPKALQ